MVSSSTCPSWSRPSIPRFGTFNPHALATIVCSNETFEPSAKLVTIVGFCPQRSAKPCWVVGFR